MELEKARKIVESLARGERNYIHGDWDRAEAMSVVLVEAQRKLAAINDAPNQTASEKAAKENAAATGEERVRSLEQQLAEMRTKLAEVGSRIAHAGYKAGIGD